MVKVQSVRRVVLVGVALVVGWMGSLAFAFDPSSGDYSRDAALDVRIVSYNHNRNFIDDPSRDAAFDRVLTLLDPDIVVFQEFPSSVSQGDVSSRMDSILPIGGGASWQIHFGDFAGIRTVIASRFPLSMTRIDTDPPAATRGVTIALADLPDADYPTDVYLLGVHLKCCGNPGGSEDDSRQASADAIANWLGDARGVARPSGDNVSLPLDTPMINLGDFNLVGGPQPEDTLITGNVQDEGTYGPDVQGDWDVSDMTNLMPADPFTGDTFTWQGNSNFAPSALDRIFFTDSVVTVANSFVLNSDTMTPTALSGAGLQSGDTLPQNTSDHLPIVIDLRLVVVPPCGSDPECDDGVFCNGAETCVANACQPGTPIDCNDNVACTNDSCNEGTDSCDNVTDDTNCDNGQFCDGAETCHATLGCQNGTAVDCNDNVSCTNDSCNEVTNSCDNVTDDTNCDNGQFCDGAETCHATLGCQSGMAVDCNDNVSCTNDSCNEVTNSCDNVADDTNCDNGQFCDGAETCHATLGCQSGTAVDCNDNVACTNDSCNEGTDSCESVADDANCDNNLFCDGTETCDAVLGCQAGVPPVLDDGVDCTDDTCDDALDVVVNTPNDANCDNGLFCDGGETCNATLGCQAGADPCSGSVCDEQAQVCEAAQVPTVGNVGLVILTGLALLAGGRTFRRRSESV
jgi:endonuclease/exonuclease/phosphatase family metal-dependent hydrolase